MTGPSDAIARNRAQQIELYGEPLGDLLGRVAAQLGITRARIAGVLGVSAPMLSQLMSAQRIKFGNPVAGQRLQSLLELVDEVTTGVAPRDRIEQRLSDISAHTGAMTVGTTSVQRATTATSARTIQALLRAIAPAGDILAAADQIAAEHPEIAEFLRVYGAGRTENAIAHLQAREHLL